MQATVLSPDLPLVAEPPDPDAEYDFHAYQVAIPVKLGNLPPFNAVATQVLGLTADPDVELRQLSRVIEGDPAFAADILFLVNSSLFGFPSRMRVLRRAIAVLGFERIKALAVTVAMRGFVGYRNPLIHQCWQHSVACAIVCEELAVLFNFSGDRAYTAGILHDIGRLGLLKSYPKEMAQVLTGTHTNTVEVLRAERAAFQVDHAHAGSWLATTWAFPEDLCEICAYHHHAPDKGDSEMLQLVKVACSVADAIGFPAVKCERQPTFLVATSSLATRLGSNALPPSEDLRANVTARLGAFEI